MVTLNAENAKTETDIGGRRRPLPGRYHAIVKMADDSMEKSDKIVVEFDVLSGTMPGQEGTSLTEWFPIAGADEAKTKTCLARLSRLAMALGLLRPGEKADVDFGQARGRQCVIEVEENKYKDRDGNEKTGVRCSFCGFWSLGHAEVADVPKDAKLAAMASAQSQAPAASNGASQGQPKQQKPAAAGGGKSAYDDLV